jgi:ribokinase
LSEIHVEPYKGMDMNRIIVIGGINMDLVVSTDRAPRAGETLDGLSFQTVPGGKGANQAVAIARQGSEVAMIARTGNDSFGKDLIDKLAKNKVDIKAIRQDTAHSTGVALIVVEKSGQNRIIVVPGANRQVDSADVDSAADLFDHCDYLVMQLEVPMPVLVAAIAVAKSKNVKTVLNAAPAPTIPIDEALLRQIDYLLVNETEAEAIAGLPVKDQQSASQVARSLQQRTHGTVIITLGDQGAVAADKHSVWLTPSFKIDAVDTTAAGDAFIGGLISSLQRGLLLKDAIIHANAAGALAASKFGAQPSLPTLAEIQQFISANC